MNSTSRNDAFPHELIKLGKPVPNWKVPKKAGLKMKMKKWMRKRKKREMRMDKMKRRERKKGRKAKQLEKSGKKREDKSHNLFKFVLVLLSASVESVGVSRMRDFFKDFI